MSDENNNYILNHSEKLQEVLNTLSPNQVRFVIAMQEFKSKKDAAASLGIPYPTVLGYPKEVDTAIRLLNEDRVSFALLMRRQALVKAMQVKLSGLDSNDEKIRQAVSTEILENELGKALERTEISGNLSVKLSDAERATQVAALLARAKARGRVIYDDNDSST